MKSLIFDSSSIISLAMNDLLWTIKPLKEKFKGDFIIPKDVKEELIDRPLKSKKYKFEALMVLDLVENNILKIYQKENSKKVEELLNLANSIFEARNENIKILHKGEIGSLIVSNELKSNGFVVDERTTRVLIENPNKLQNILEKKLHTKIKINKDKLRQFREKTKDIKILRSTELTMMAYEMKLFDKYLKIKRVKNIKRELLDGLLWGLRLRGCSISNNEINEIIRSE